MKKLERIFTPKETEELKPGFFVQKKGDKYKQIEPVFWKGKWRWNKQFTWRNLFMIIIILGLFFTLKKYVIFYEAFHQDPVEFCMNHSEYIINFQEVMQSDGQDSVYSFGNFEGVITEDQRG